MGARFSIGRAWSGAALAAATLALAPGTAAAGLLPPLNPDPPPSEPSPQPQPSQPSSPPPDSRTITFKVAPVGPSTPQLGSTTLGANAQRTAYVNDPSLVTPLEVRWSRRTPQHVKSVVYGDGLGYAAMENSVMAFNLRTGATVWTAPGQPQFLSFGNGVLVSPEQDGSIVARSARTGAHMWRSRVDDVYPSYRPALVSGQVVYAESSGTVAAFSLSSGERLWSTNTGGGDTILSTDGGRVYAAYGCGEVAALDAATGLIAWQRRGDCSGGTSSGSIVTGGRVYEAERKAILDPASGGLLGTTPVFLDAIAGTIGIGGRDNRIYGFDLTTQRQLWVTGALGPNGTGAADIAGRALVVSHSLYTIEPGSRLRAYSLEEGTREQTLTLQANDPESSTDASPAAAPGTLLVPAGRRLTAYQSVYRPAPNGVDVGAPVADVEYGKRATVDGVIGTSLRGGSRRVVGQIAAYRRKRFRNSGSFSTGLDGFFSASAKGPRNFRVRILAGTARSKTLRVYVYPRYRSKLKRAGRSNRIRASVRVAVPKAVRLRGRRVVLYQAQPSRKRFVRLGAARLRGAGKGRGRATVRFKALASASKRDFLFYCIPRASRLGLGRADVLDRRCGRARLPLR